MFYNLLVIKYPKTKTIKLIKKLLKLFIKEIFFNTNNTIVEKDTFNKNPFFKKHNLYIKNDFQYFLLENEINDISTIVEIMPPNPKDKKRGNIRILLKKEEIGNIKIFSKSKKKKDHKNIFQKIIQKII